MRSSCRSLWRRLQPTGAAWNTLESSFLPPWLACSSPSSAALLPTALSPPSSPAAPFHASAAAPTAAAPSPPLGRSDAPPDQGGGPSLSSLASLFPHIQQQLAGAYQEGARERLTKLLEAAAQRNPSIHSGARSDSGSRSGPPLDPENPAHLALLGADDLLEVAADCALDSQGVALPLDSAEDLAAALAAMLREQRAARSGPAAAQQRAREAEARGEAGGRASRRAFKGLDGQQGHRTAPPLARLEEEEEQGAEGVIDAVQQAADRLFDAELAERLQRAAASRGGVPAPNLAVSSSSAAAAPPATAVAATTPLPSVDVDAAAAAGVASDNGSKRSSSSSVVVYTTPQPPLDQLPLVSAPATAAVARQYGLRNSRSTPLFISDPVDPFAPLPDVAVYRGKARARLDRLLMRSNTRQRADKQPHDAADVGALMLLKRSELADLAVDCEWGRADMGKEQLAKCISAALLQQEGGTAAGRVWVQASEVAAENAAALEKAARRKKKLLMLLPAEDGDGQSGNGAGGSGEGDGSAGHAAAWQGRQPGASGGERGGGPQAGERFVMQDPMGRTGYRQRVFEVPAEAFSALPLQVSALTRVFVSPTPLVPFAPLLLSL